MDSGCIRTGNGQAEYFDTKIPGLALRVTRNSVKSWTLVYRHEGRVRRWTIGRYPDLSLADTREKAADARREIAHEADPAEGKTTGACRGVGCHGKRESCSG